MYNIKEYEEKYETSVIELISDIMMQEHKIEWSREGFINELKEDLKTIEKGKSSFLIVTDASDKIIGTGALINKEKDKAELKRMYIAKEHRGNGLAQKIIDKLMETAHINQYENIYLGTYEKLKPAIRFYSKNKFETYKENDGKVYMRLNLVQA